ncbi:MAG: hypothetical protein LBP27_03445, partial [Treponema sp.]|nr:hypothetical protein [Treponema sp.]
MESLSMKILPCNPFPKLHLPQKSGKNTLSASAKKYVRIFGVSRQKPGFPLQVLGFADAKPVGFPLQSRLHGRAIILHAPANARGSVSMTTRP